MTQPRLSLIVPSLLARLDTRVVFCRRADCEAVGGFDERLMRRYWHEDHQEPV